MALLIDVRLRLCRRAAQSDLFQAWRGVGAKLLTGGRLEAPASQASQSVARQSNQTAPLPSGDQLGSRSRPSAQGGSPIS